MVIRVLTCFIAFLAGLNYWGWQEYYFGLILGLTWLILTSWLLGNHTANFTSTRTERLIWGLILVSSIISTVGAVLFYINLFNPTTIIILGIILPCLTTDKKTKADEIKPVLPWSKIIIFAVLSLIYLLLTAITFLLLKSFATPEAIRTPWSIVSPSIFILIGLSSAVLLYIIKNKTSPIWLIPFYLIFLSLLINIYPLSYGFDPFIHQASEKLLAATGTINPKPLYYLGQYTQVVFGAQILNLPIKIIDTWLMPLMATLFLPVIFFSFVKKITPDKLLRLLIPITPLLFTLSYFTYTTPQGLAYLFVLITILSLALRLMGVNISWLMLCLFGLTAVLIHPLAGLPILGILALAWLKEYGLNLKNKKLWRLGIAAGTALIVPISFAIMSWLNPSSASIKFSLNLKEKINDLVNNIYYNLPFLPRFIDLPDGIYLWGRTIIFIFIILAILGYWLASKQYQNLTFIGQVSLLPLISFLILSLFFTFPNLPPNEQNFYTSRLWDITLLLLWPLTLLGIYWLGKNILPLFRYEISWIVIGSLLLLASFYLTYPRFDTWHHDTAYNTTAYDIIAVRLINHQAAGSSYVVLANQAVAAAAVNEFGFTKYYNGHFYYPLPTGTNPLYQIYLNATERGLPIRDIIAPAANLGVSQVFLVLNNYWASYDTLNQIAKVEADAWWEIGNGRLTVYRYDF